MQTYEELAKSRREWIDEVLIPWSRTASQKELLKAEGDWVNVAGQVDPEATLWTWAWSRFPALIHPDMSGVDETRELSVQLIDGRVLTGYPDGRLTKRGQLYLLGRGETLGPLAIDEITAVTPVDDPPGTTAP